MNIPYSNNILVDSRHQEGPKTRA